MGNKQDKISKAKKKGTLCALQSIQWIDYLAANFATAAVKASILALSSSILMSASELFKPSFERTASTRVSTSALADTLSFT
jgi:hypothetical protein